MNKAVSTVSGMLRLLATLLVSLTITFLSVSSVLATEQTTREAGKLSTSPVGANELANVTMGLLLVLALIFALAWLFRRYGNLPSFNKNSIQILGGVSLGTREKAILLEVEGQRLLVGVAPGQVTRLHTFAPTQNNESPSQSEEDDEFSMTLKQEQQKTQETSA